MKLKNIKRYAWVACRLKIKNKKSHTYEKEESILTKRCWRKQQNYRSWTKQIVERTFLCRDKTMKTAQPLSILGEMQKTDTPKQLLDQNDICRLLHLFLWLGFQLLAVRCWSKDFLDSRQEYENIKIESMWFSKLNKL